MASTARNKYFTPSIVRKSGIDGALFNVELPPLHKRQEDEYRLKNPDLRLEGKKCPKQRLWLFHTHIGIETWLPILRNEKHPDYRAPCKITCLVD